MDNASVEDIIQNANISRGTFYSYFKSKLDLLLSLPEINQLSNFGSLFEIRYPMFTRLSPEAKLELFFETMYEMILKPSDMDIMFNNLIITKTDSCINIYSSSTFSICHFKCTAF